jgi:hypothetical protein
MQKKGENGADNIHQRTGKIEKKFFFIRIGRRGAYPETGTDTV